MGTINKKAVGWVKTSTNLVDLICGPIAALSSASLNQIKCYKFKVLQVKIYNNVTNLSFLKDMFDMPLSVHF